MYKLDKPYTLRQRTDFISKYEQSLGLTIIELDNSLIALEPNEYINQDGNIELDNNYNIKTLNDIKNNKLEENNNIAKYVKYNTVFTINIQDKLCEFDTSLETQLNLLTAYAITSSGYIYGGFITKNNIELDLTLNDTILILTKFVEHSNVAPVWNAYRQLINQAKDIESVENIIIDYKLNV